MESKCHRNGRRAKRQPVPGNPIEAFDKAGRRIKDGDKVAFVNRNGKLDQGTVSAIIGKYVDNTPYGDLQNVTYQETYRQEKNAANENEEPVNIDPDEVILIIDMGEYRTPHTVCADSVYKLL